jgi:hypothetical protein
VCVCDDPFITRVEAQLRCDVRKLDGSRQPAVKVPGRHKEAAALHAGSDPTRHCPTRSSNSQRVFRASCGWAPIPRDPERHGRRGRGYLHRASVGSRERDKS